MAKTILVVDDDETIRRVLTDKFEGEKFNVLTADNGEVGLSLALAKHPNIVLLDLVMSRMDGMGMLKALRQDGWGKEVPVMILTNVSNGDEVGEALKYNVYDFLVKTDWSLEDVVERVKMRLKSVVEEDNE